MTQPGPNTHGSPFQCGVSCRIRGSGPRPGPRYVCFRHVSTFSAALLGVRLGREEDPGGEPQAGGSGEVGALGLWALKEPWAALPAPCLLLLSGDFLQRTHTHTRLVWWPGMEQAWDTCPFSFPIFKYIFLALFI